MSEKYCLKWNDFHHNVSNSFHTLRREDYLHDVTLVTDDHKQIAAHKLILSATSEYFHSLFRKNINPNMMICLDGIKMQDLTNCLDYMYDGEVQLYQDDLDRFLSVAQKFEIKGLQNNETFSENDHLNFNDQKCTTKYEDTQEEYKPPTVIKQKNIVPIKKGEMFPHRVLQRRNNLIDLSSVDDYDRVSETSKYIEKLEDGNLKCTACGKISNDKRKGDRLVHMRSHIETHFEGLSYPCQTCNRICKSKEALRKHKVNCVSQHQEKMVMFAA